MSDKSYTTKVLLEVEVKHQFGPEQGVNIIVGQLTGPTIPAITSVKVLKVESNHHLFKEIPFDIP